MEEQNQEIRARTLPELRAERNALRTRLATMGIDSQIMAKTVLQSASDSIRADSDAFRKYLRKIYEDRKKEDSQFSYDEKNITSAEYDTITQHIEDLVKESSNSSIFERADKLKIMKYIETAINNADINEREKRQLIEQYIYATETIKTSTGMFDKASALLIRNIGNITGVLGSIFSDLPPIFGWMLTRGGDVISGILERRRTRKERLASLEYDITSERDNRNTSSDRPSLFKQQNNTDVQKDVNQNLNDIFTEALSNNENKNNFSESKIERIRNESGSLLDRAPTGTESDPLYVVLKGGLPDTSEKKKSSGLLSMIPLIGGIFKKFGVVVGAFGTAVATLGTALGIKKAADAIDTNLPSADADKSTDKKKKKRKGKKTVPKKQGFFDRALNGTKETAGKASKFLPKLGSLLKLGSVAGIVTELADPEVLGNSELPKDWNNDNSPITQSHKLAQEYLDSKTSEERKRAILEQVKGNEELEKFFNAQVEMQKNQKETLAKMQQKTNADSGLVYEAKLNPRATLEQQTIMAAKKREQNNSEKRAAEIALHQNNTSNIVNNYNQNNTQHTNRVIQVVNPQAQIVHGSLR